MMAKLTPTIEEIERLRLTVPPGPVTILNLLKFKEGVAARAAYRRYMAAARPASDPNMEILYSGEAIADVGAGEDWDYIIIARYRQFEDFARTVTHPAFQHDAASHRPDALEKTLMIVSQDSALTAL